MKNVLTVIGGIFCFLFLLALIWGIGFGFKWGDAKVQKVFLDIERDNVKHSHQYIETEVVKLNRLVTEYQAASTEYATYEAANENGKYTEVLNQLQTQMDAIVNEMTQAATQIPAREVPDSVLRIIN